MFVNKNNNQNPVFKKPELLNTAQTVSDNASVFCDSIKTQEQTNANNITCNKQAPDTTDWTEVKPEKNKFLLWEVQGYTYNLEDGTKISVDDIDNVVVKTDPKTGEIFVSGLSDGTVTCSKSGTKISIYDSTLNEIEGKKGDDIIGIYNSNVKTIDGAKGDDLLTIMDSVVKEIETSKGNDSIYADKSQIEKINSGTGKDTVVIVDSKVQDVLLEKGNDALNVKNSEIETIKGQKGDDSIVVENSNIGNIDASKGADNIAICSNSTIKNLKTDKKDTIENIEMSQFDYSVESLDSASMDCAQEIFSNKASLYTSKKNLTQDEQYQLLALDFFSQNLSNMRAQFEEQNNSDGVVHNSYNYVKELTDLGISKEDINAALEEQEQMVEEMQLAFSGKSDKSFEEVFEKWTGVPYDRENLNEYLENAQLYSLAVNGMAKTEAFKEAVSNAKNLDETIELFTNYYGSEEKGREKLNEFLQTSLEEHPEVCTGLISIEINENNELVTTRTDSMDAFGGYDEDSVYTTVEDPDDVVNMIRTLSVAFDLDKFSDDFKEQFETSVQISFDALQNKYISSQLETFGRDTAFQKLIDKYCADQEGFSDRLATACQAGGIGLMVIGGVTTFVCPPAGLGVMTAGKYTAIGGTFGDNVLDLVDATSSQTGLTKDEARKIAKETLTEAALLYSGSKINGVASGVQGHVLSATQNEILSKFARLGTDASLSLLADFMITGEVNLTGEGISQLLGIFTGVAGARVSEYRAEMYSDANKMYSQGDIDGACKYLDSKGCTDADIKAFVSQNKINDAFVAQKTTSTDKIVASLNEMQGLTEADLKVANELYSQIENLGYKDFINEHPEVFKGMFDSARPSVDAFGYPRQGAQYQNMTKEQMQVVEYAVNQLDSGAFETKWLDAIDARVDSSVPYELCRYIDNPQEIPEQGIAANKDKSYYYPKEQCLEWMETKVLPLKECLSTQSTPCDIDVTRIDNIAVFDSIKVGETPLSAYMQSNDPETIKNLLTFFNSGGASVTYDNFIGTTIDDGVQMGKYCSYDDIPGVAWQLNVPQGSQGLFLEPLAYSPIYTEGEFLLQAGTKFEITGARFENNMWYFDATVVQDF